MSRENLKKLPFTYWSLPLSQFAEKDGIYWNPAHSRVEAIKCMGTPLDGPPCFEVFAWIDSAALDRDGLMGFIKWEALLWGN